MKKLRKQIICVAITAVTLSGAHASYPSELLQPFDFEALPFPGYPFSDEDKTEQHKRGEPLVEEITRACQRGDADYTIPPGNYRFKQLPVTDHAAPDRFCFNLKNLKRPDRNPFTIKAHGVTFWFELHGQPSPLPNWNMQFYNCDNIILEGLTFDTDSQASIEGKVTAIDREQNRVEILLSSASREISVERINADGGGKYKGYHKRIVIYNREGKYITPSYYLDDAPGSWGVGHMQYSKVEKSEKPYHLWFYMNTPKLLEKTARKEWQDVYGTNALFEVGSYVVGAWATAPALVLTGSRQLTVKDCNIYLIGTQIGAMENGGFGGHRWMNTKLMRRPGSCRLRGPDGFMFGNTQKGPLLDGVVVEHTFDDVLNIFANYGFVKKTEDDILFVDEDDGALVRNGGLHGMPYGLSVGHRIELYDPDTKLLLEKLTVVALPGGNRVKVDKTVDVPAGTIMGFKDFECANWEIRNCYFIESYQRILIQTGPGLFENNYVRGIGSSVDIGANYEGYEGGSVSGVTVANNLFLDCSTSTTTPLFNIYKAVHLDYKDQMNLIGNIIVNPGNSAALIDSIRDSVIRDNIIINPIRQTARMLENTRFAGNADTKAITLNGCSDLILQNNVLIERTPYTVSDRATGDGLANALSKKAGSVTAKSNIWLDDKNGKVLADIYTLNAACNDTSELIKKIKKRVYQEQLLPQKQTH